MTYNIAQDIVVDPIVNSDTLEIAFEQWQSYQPRYKMLADYYLGQHQFDDGTHPPDQNRVVANHCRYITDVLVGYQFGNEPRYTTEDGDTAGQAILDLFKAQDKWSIEVNIGEDLSRFGRTYELVYMPTDKNEPNSIELDPMHAFVAYAGDVEKDSVFGAVVFSYTDNQRRTIYRLYVYDTVNMSIWESDGSLSSPRTWHMTSEPLNHGFGRVPLIEYKNNRQGLSDYEGILSLQDAYNALLSDRQDNQDSFAQAMLVLSGTVIGRTAEEIQDGKKVLKSHAVLQLDEDAVAQYLVKPSVESDIQVLTDEYGRLIHKLCSVPDLSDEKFSGNASGVAMAYKLFGTDQLVAKKQSMMQRGFTRRCKLYDYRLNNPTMIPSYTPLADIDHMTITFNLNAPQDLSYIATALTQLTGGGRIMSLQTARTLVSDISDPEQETELVRQENEEQAQLTRDTYDYDEVDAERKKDALNDDDETDTEE